MDQNIEQLVAEVAAVTGAQLPGVLDEHGPVLRDAKGDGGEFYLVGLIGGKEVGKSALVNALVGQPITDSTSYGPGTETAIAYAHEAQAGAVKELLEREARGRYKIVTHTLPHLHRQVLLDLPDVDSVYDDHIELTRRMLRHMLFPIWIQSVEKYADLQPQKLLAAVAEGNDPANFLFVLNKADQLSPDAVQELREDYATRIARTLKRASPPKVFVISAIQPDRFDLPELREKLAEQKSTSVVKQSIDLAGRQRERSMVRWLQSQQLPERVLRLRRLEEQAADLAAERLATPLLERALPRILDDPLQRAAIVDEVMNGRVARWPIVNMLHTLLAPMTAIWRRNVGSAATPELLVASAIDVEGRTLSGSVQATFALLQQTNPMIGQLYRQQKLWEQMPADVAAARLSRAIVSALQSQRTAAMTKIARFGIIAPLFRWLLTIGALLWFPLVQPILELGLQDTLNQSVRGLLLLIVQLLGVTYLLKSAAFLALWYLVLWMYLRWDTQRRVTKLLSRWRSAERAEAGINATAAVLAWVDELLDPIRAAREKEEALAKRTEVLAAGLIERAA
jgi:GTP-binding protein EngB required for normal cell division